MFFWNSTPSHNKIPTTQWQNIAKPKKFGGLGIKNLDIMNKAFTMKHIWRLLIDHNSLWARVLKSKYFPNTWNLPLIIKSVPSFLLHHIIGTPLPITLEQDTPMWNPSSDGHFSVKFTYYWLMLKNNNAVFPQLPWNRLWNRAMSF